MRDEREVVTDVERREKGEAVGKNVERKLIKHEWKMVRGAGSRAAFFVIL